MKNLNFEMTQAAYVIANDLCKIKPGENVAVTADTSTEESIVNSIAGAVLAAGGKPVIFGTPPRAGLAKPQTKMFPIKPSAPPLVTATSGLSLEACGSSIPAPRRLRSASIKNCVT